MTEKMWAKFAQALQLVQGVPKNQEADTGKYRYRYTDLSDVLAVVKQALAEVGLSLSQPIHADGDKVRVVTMLIDCETGDALEFQGVEFRMMNDPQAVGSAITYARRYNLTSLFALTVVDDDGKAASIAAQRPQPAAARTEAEHDIREFIATLETVDKRQFVADFKGHFGCGLAALPLGRHDEALEWAQAWEPEPPFVS